ncbi:MAG: TlpA family protein disulfide reductase [Acidobacteriota bacterium]|nr:TlpA family protein disulfide reductase [Acidobacteriota bacterium]
MKLRVSARAIAAVLGIMTAGAGWDSQQKANTTDSAPQFRSLDGHSHSLAELKGHVAVVNFWATWCGPCREEMPRLQRLADEYTPKGVTFVALSLDDSETQKKIEQVVAKRGFKIPVWTGATEQTFKELELGVLVPTTLMLDQKGDVFGKIEGEARNKDIRSRLDWVLNGRQGKQPKVVQKNDW